MEEFFDPSLGHDPERSYRLVLRVPPEPEYARTVRSAMASFCAYHGIPPSEMENLTFALGEAVANAIEHGGRVGEIEVTCEIDALRIVARVIDRGSGFDYSDAERAMLPSALAEGGRGLPIIRCCSHFFEVSAAPEGGTAVTFGRYRKST